jgi:phospholipid/cholesterol/gamma-HCH transport system substrate-binding protein
MGRQLSELRRHRLPLVAVTAFAAIALTMTMTVAGTLSRSAGGDHITVTALFSDATGLRAGDDVRVAGVRVGRVGGTRLGTGDQKGLAVVTLTVAADQHLAANTVAAVDYLNLMGQRYVSLERPSGTPEGRLTDGATIPLASTRPPLDLTALFNAFKPIFDLLQPGDINRLAQNLVGALQGEGPTLRDLLLQTGRLTNGLADRDAVLSRVTTNVTAVLDATYAHRRSFTALLAGLSRLSTGLAADRQQIATGLESLARLSRVTADVVAQAGPSVIDDARLSAQWLAWLRAHERQLVAAGGAIPKQLRTYLRTLGYGSYLNTYVCNLMFKAGGQQGALWQTKQYSRRCTP